MGCLILVNALQNNLRFCGSGITNIVTSQFLPIDTRALVWDSGSTVRKHYIHKVNFNLKVCCSSNVNEAIPCTSFLCRHFIGIVLQRQYIETTNVFEVRYHQNLPFYSFMVYDFNYISSSLVQHISIGTVKLAKTICSPILPQKIYC